MSLAPVTNRYTYAELASFLGVESPEDHAEGVWESVVGGDYSWTKEEAIRQLREAAAPGSEAPTEEQVEEKCQEITDEVIDGECDECDKRYRGAIRTVAENLFSEHLLELTEVEEEGKESYFVVEPKKDSTTGWYRAASKIIDTINGVGMFEFRTVRELVESGPYPTIEQAVLQHAHWISSYPEVYEGTKAKFLVERRLR